MSQEKFEKQKEIEIEDLNNCCNPIRINTSEI
jgi:hypothetical protein